mmetsp:Transcript_3378/g.21081  ORF Transcript_3378/g.21081 Transcript_3378/m.21081 type:complete len:206 (-) Transcript_3378:1375-1992(-)
MPKVRDPDGSLCHLHRSRSGQSVHTPGRCTHRGQNGRIGCRKRGHCRFNRGRSLCGCRQHAGGRLVRHCRERGGGGGIPGWRGSLLLRHRGRRGSTSIGLCARPQSCGRRGYWSEYWRNGCVLPRPGVDSRDGGQGHGNYREAHHRRHGKGRLPLHRDLVCWTDDRQKDWRAKALGTQHSIWGSRMPVPHVEAEFRSCGCTGCCL